MKKLSMDVWRRVFQEQMQEAKPGDVWNLQMDQQLPSSRLQPGRAQSLQERTRARFTCSQCYHSWSSHHVAVLFHMYWEPYKRRGQVWMRLFRQKCPTCPSEKYQEPQFTEMDIVCAIQHLIHDIREKCYQEALDHSRLSEALRDMEVEGIHLRQTCEACQMGLHKKHHGKPEDTVHHGRPQGVLQYGTPPNSVYFWTISNQCATFPIAERANRMASCILCVGIFTVLLTVYTVVMLIIYFYK